MRSVAQPVADGRTVHVAWTERADGDLAIDGAPRELEARRRSVVDRPWVWLRQVHGAAVVEVGDADPDDVRGIEADATVTRRDDIALAVHAADCVVAALWTGDGAIAAVHCGWRGLESGILDAAVAGLRSLSDSPIAAFLGPSIGPECYQFGVGDLDRLRVMFGDVVVATTATGEPALDVRAGVRSRLVALGVEVVPSDERCTACESDTCFSHRARGEAERHALVVWVEA